MTPDAPNTAQSPHALAGTDGLDGTALAERVIANRTRHTVARLVSLMEDTRREAVPAKDAALAVLDEHARSTGHRCRVLGVTGTPGAGKSSLMSVVTRRMLEIDAQIAVAVVAVDPSSPVSGGSLLGDRTRMRRRTDNRLYFRSQPSVTALGGLAPATYAVVRALSALYDCVLVETVGIGQSEVDIRYLADRVYLVIAPNGGDDVQMLKAGIIEIPDSFVMNKSDEPASNAAYHQLKASMWLARPFDHEDVRIFRTSALTGAGIEEFADDLHAQAQPVREEAAEAAAWRERDAYFLRSWVREEWGRAGMRHLEELGGASAVLAGAHAFGAAQLAFDADLRARLDTAHLDRAARSGTA